MMYRPGRRATVLLLVALASVAPCLAQVYKCGRGAATLYSDKPCEDGPGTPVKAATVGPQGHLDFHVDTLHYAVSGANLREAYASMRANGPNGWAGFARWHVNYKYESKQVSEGCSIASVTVKVRGDIRMPEWKYESMASAGDQQNWRNMYALLKRHEDGHIQHGREFGLLLKERLMGMGAMPCADLQASADREYRALYGNLKRRDEEYDARTDHGLRQDNPR